jgi:hypothetical protein
MSEHTPGGSIIERFRGTEWAAPEPPPPPPPRRGRGALTLVLAVLVIGGAVGGIAILASNLGTSPGGEVQFLPDDGITPRVPDSIRVLDAFWALARDPELAYHLEGTGEFKSEAFTTTFELSLDIAGDDYTGTVNTIDGSGFAEIIRLDGVMYLRQPGTAWFSRRTNDAGLRQDPFMGLSGRRELVYDGKLVEDGATHHRLVSTEFYAPSVARMLDLGAFHESRPQTRTLELIVTDEGVPLRATFSLLVEGSAVDGLAPIEGHAEYTFTDVGVPIVVATPAP